MIIDNINLNHIRIFESVFRTGSMTRAAEELHMTQSGVSQHIKILEELLEKKLFDRIKQRLVPTGDATELFKSSSQGLYSIEKGLSQIIGRSSQLKGTAHIGVPIEFGNNVILPLLAQFGIAHPDVKFKMVYGYASQMNAMLLNGSVDFAFLDDFSNDKQIESKEVFEENLVLCATQEYLDRFKIDVSVENKELFEKFGYIAYVDDEPLIRLWFKKQFDWNSIKINVRATLMDVYGISKLISRDLGVGVIPMHRLNNLEKKGKKIHIFKGNDKTMKNKISIAYVKKRTLSPMVRSLIEFFPSKFDRSFLH